MRVLTGETERTSFLAPSTMWGHSERTEVCAGRQALIRRESAAPRSWVFPGSRTLGNEFLCCLWATQPMAFCYNSTKRLRHFLRAWHRENPFLGYCIKKPRELCFKYSLGHHNENYVTSCCWLLRTEMWNDSQIVRSRFRRCLEIACE